MAQPKATATTGAGLRTDVAVRNHRIITDEPVHVGGGDEGATAYELLYAALAACTATTARMYANRKGWPLDEVRVRVRHERIDADHAGRPDAGPVRTDIFDLEVEFDGDLDDEQRERLLTIAGRCPVKKTLQGPVRLTTHGPG